MPAGRPPKTCVDPDVANAICAHLEIGLPFELAAEAEGVAQSTAYAWMERFEEFAGQVTRARAVGALKLTRLSLKGGKGSSAALWHLERRYHKHYSPPRAEPEKQDTVIQIIGGLPPSPQ